MKYILTEEHVPLPDKIEAKVNSKNVEIKGLFS